MLKKVLTNAVLPIFASLIIGAILITSIGVSVVDVFDVIGNIFSDSNSVAEIFVSTIPLICTGLSVAFAFRTGLFNIGAEGQFIMGGLFAGIVAIKMQGANFYVVLLCSILAGIIVGGLWAAIAGYLKARFNISEVVVTIMLNYTALYFVQFAVPKFIKGTNDIISKPIATDAGEGYLHNGLIEGIFNNYRLGTDLYLAIIAVILFYVVMEKTVFGYELRSVGFNPNASKFVGMKVNRNTVLSMAISGAFAGLGGALYNMGPVGQVVAGATFQGFGYMGIAVALIGANTALGVFLGALLFGFLGVLTQQLTFIGIPKDIANILIGLIVMFVAAKAIFDNKLLDKLFTKKKKGDK